MEGFSKEGNEGSSLKFKYVERGTHHCICVLNSRVYKHWEWYSTLKDLDISALHVFDQTFSWYHNCIDSVRSLLDKYRPARIVGVSMGGYAALLFGSLHGIHAKAFGPQTTLETDWDKRWEDELVKVKQTTKYPEYLDLSGRKMNADIYYCQAVELDKRHAKRLKNQATLIARGCSRHEDAGKNLLPSEIFDIERDHVSLISRSDD